MPTPPVDVPLNLLTQDVLTWGSWILTAVVLGVAVSWGLKERTPFYVLLVLAAAVGAFAEPLYDAAMMLYFYSTPGMYTHFTWFIWCPLLSYYVITGVGRVQAEDEAAGIVTEDDLAAVASSRSTVVAGVVVSPDATVNGNGHANGNGHSVAPTEAVRPPETVR